jgi:hypothetical protein
MSRYERGQYFEALVGLRAAYAARPDDDRRSTILIDDAILYAEAVMKALEEEDAITDLANLGPMASRSSASDLGAQVADSD